MLELQDSPVVWRRFRHLAICRSAATERSHGDTSVPWSQQSAYLFVSSRHLKQTQREASKSATPPDPHQRFAHAQMCNSHPQSAVGQRDTARSVGQRESGGERNVRHVQDSQRRREGEPPHHVALENNFSCDGPPPQALLINKQGQSMVVDGPQRVAVFRKSFERLSRVSADQYQYIRVQKANGEVEHMPG